MNGFYHHPTDTGRASVSRNAAPTPPHVPMTRWRAVPSVRGAAADGDDDDAAADDFTDFDEVDAVVFVSTCAAIESVTGATSTTVMDGAAVAAVAAFGGSHMRTSAGHASCGK